MNLSYGSSQIDEYWALWGDSMCQVLGQITSSSPKADLNADTAKLADGEWLCFEAGKALAGNQAIHLSAADAGRLARMLLAESPADTSPLSADHRNALTELFRQIAGVMATNIEDRTAEKVEFRFLNAKAPAWSATQKICLQIHGEKLPALTIRMCCDAELDAAIARPSVVPDSTAQATRERSLGEKEEPGVSFVSSGSSGVASKAPQQDVPAEPRLPIDRSLEMFLDVNLDVTLRFGERQMMLGDIMELGAGAVVELDRQIQEPVELLVSGRVVARGEVVIVSGNYGLRITEVVSSVGGLEAAAAAR